MNIGEKIRKRRDELGMTATDLASAAAVSLSYISKLENDSKSAPSLKVVKQLAKALHCPAEYLLSDLAVAPETVLDLTPDIKSWLARQDSQSYIRLAKDLHDQKVNPNDARKILEAMRLIIERNQK